MSKALQSPNWKTAWVMAQTGPPVVGEAGPHYPASVRHWWQAGRERPGFLIPPLTQLKSVSLARGRSGRCAHGDALE